MKYLKLFIVLAGLICAVSFYMYITKVDIVSKNTRILPKTPPVKTESTLKNNDVAMPGMRKTDNQMGYEDTEKNLLLQKYLDFIPQAPGNLLDLGCAWGFAIQQVLAIDKQLPFLKQHNIKIIAIDMDQNHLDQVAANTPPEMVETINMHFPKCDSQQCITAFAPESLGATYAGLFLHYLNPAELTQGLKLLFEATASGGRVYASVNSAYIAPPLAEDFLRRKQNPDDPFPGWYPNVFDKSVPEKARKVMPKSVCGRKIKFLHVFDKETLSRYFENAGFRVVEQFYFNRNKMVPMQLLGIIAEKTRK